MYVLRNMTPVQSSFVSSRSLSFHLIFIRFIYFPVPVLLIHFSFPSFFMIQVQYFRRWILPPMHALIFHCTHFFFLILPLLPSFVFHFPPFVCQFPPPYVSVPFFFSLWPFISLLLPLLSLPSSAHLYIARPASLLHYLLFSVSTLSAVFFLWPASCLGWLSVKGARSCLCLWKVCPLLLCVEYLAVSAVPRWLVDGSVADWLGWCETAGVEPVAGCGTVRCVLVISIGFIKCTPP